MDTVVLKRKGGIPPDGQARDTGWEDGSVVSGSTVDEHVSVNIPIDESEIKTEQIVLPEARDPSTEIPKDIEFAPSEPSQDLSDWYLQEGELAEDNDDDLVAFGAKKDSKKFIIFAGLGAIVLAGLVSVVIGSGEDIAKEPIPPAPAVTQKTPPPTVVAADAQTTEDSSESATADTATAADPGEASSVDTGPSAEEMEAQNAKDEASKRSLAAEKAGDRAMEKQAYLEAITNYQKALDADADSESAAEKLSDARKKRQAQVDAQSQRDRQRQTEAKRARDAERRKAADDARKRREEARARATRTTTRVKPKVKPRPKPKPAAAPVDPGARKDASRAAMRDGVTLMKSGDLAGSLKAFQRAQKLDPSSRMPGLWIKKVKAKMNP
jgi:tetratricopeptide (TPR) repeat protein